MYLHREHDIGCIVIWVTVRACFGKCVSKGLTSDICGKVGMEKSNAEGRERCGAWSKPVSKENHAVPYVSRAYTTPSPMSIESPIFNELFIWSLRMTKKGKPAQVKSVIRLIARKLSEMLCLPWRGEFTGLAVCDCGWYIFRIALSF